MDNTCTSGDHLPFFETTIPYTYILYYMLWLESTSYSGGSVKTFHSPKWLQILPGWVLSVWIYFAGLPKHIATPNPPWNKFLSTQSKLHLMMSNTLINYDWVVVCSTCRASLFSSASSCTCLISSTAKPTCKIQYIRYVNFKDEPNKIIFI